VLEYHFPRGFHTTALFLPFFISGVGSSICPKDVFCYVEIRLPPPSFFHNFFSHLFFSDSFFPALFATCFSLIIRYIVLFDCFISEIAVLIAERRPPFGPLSLFLLSFFFSLSSGLRNRIGCLFFAPLPLMILCFFNDKERFLSFSSFFRQLSSASPRR